jgi:hypothetical protein
VKTPDSPFVSPHQLSPKNAAVIELSGGHVECIYSQLLFLRQGGYTIHLICSEQLREQVSAFEPVDHFAFYSPGEHFVDHWKCVLAIRRYLIAHRITTLIFNTGGGNHTRDLCIATPPGVTLAGIVHHTHKLTGSFTQFLISMRMKKGFVLNDYLLDGIPTERRRQFASTYLLFREPVEEKRVKKNPNELWIAIPGEVDFRRRDYEGLVRELKSCGPIHGSLRFIVLGACNPEQRDGRALRALIQQSGLERHVVLFDGFVQQDAFFGYVRQCDALLPLIHPVTDFFGFYKSHQISGTYNLAFGFAKPLLIHEALRGPEDFDCSALFYTDTTLVPLLNRLAGEPEECAALATRIRSHPKFSFAHQSDNYLRFLGG